MRVDLRLRYKNMFLYGELLRNFFFFIKYIFHLQSRAISAGVSEFMVHHHTRRERRLSHTTHALGRRDTMREPLQLVSTRKVCAQRSKCAKTSGRWMEHLAIVSV